MQSFAEELKLELKADTEQQIQNYIQKKIQPILSNSKIEGACQLLINSYFQNLDPKTGLFYQARKNLMAMFHIIMATVLDKEQTEAQKIFPHYFERFKTDGVEHNLYIYYD
jgi:hypothetical protein